jgi:hypothetical protein
MALVAADLLGQQDVDTSQLPCRTADPDLFFGESPASVAAAKELCAECPVRDHLPCRLGRRPVGDGVGLDQQPGLRGGEQPPPDGAGREGERPGL